MTYGSSILVVAAPILPVAQNTAPSNPPTTYVLVKNMFDPEE